MFESSRPSLALARAPEVRPLTFARAIFEQARLRGDADYVRFHREGGWQVLTWSQFAERALRIADALISAGLAAGDRVALLSDNRVEWLLCDLGIQAAGCITVPIYPSSQPRVVRHIVEDSGARLLIAGTRELAAKLDPPPVGVNRALIDEQVRDWLEVSDRSRREETERRLAAVEPLDLATIVYTSGTTGEPKGVMLSNANLIAAKDAALAAFDLGPNDVLLSYLPYSHVLERVDGVFIPTCAGCSLVLGRSAGTLMEDIQLARPTAMIGVPRVFEKVYQAVEDQVAGKAALQRALFRWALDVGLRRLDPKAGAGLRLQAGIADRLVLKPLREKLTGGRLRFFLSGGAPLNEKVEQFFWAIGVKILQGWGMTETTSGATSNREAEHRYRTVGRAMNGLEIKIEEDGEILVRGPFISAGYYNQPQATAETITPAGWLRTGDMGFLADGFLTITDRKKDLIKTSGGKYIAPLPIEARLQSNRAVTAALVVGDERPYAVALIVPSWQVVASLAGIVGDPTKLVDDARVRAIFQTVVDECNRDLASFETVKRFVLLARDFSESLEELTPTLKPKRKVISHHFAPEIESLYSAPS